MPEISGQKFLVIEEFMVNFVINQVQRVISIHGIWRTKQIGINQSYTIQAYWNTIS